MAVFIQPGFFTLLCAATVLCKSNRSLNLKTGCAALGSNNCNQVFVITDAVTQQQLHASFTCLFHSEEVFADYLQQRQEELF